LELGAEEGDAEALAAELALRPVDGFVDVELEAAIRGWFVRGVTIGSARIWRSPPSRTR
jgi:hypothetical protein